MLFIHQAGMIKKSHPEVKIQSMLWKDDGIHEITGFSLNNTVIFSKNKS
jgi:hypothetical protein